jgi:hypothetical protein
VNLLKSNRNKLIFGLPTREKELLLALLSRYPLIPAGHQPLSKTTVLPESETNQRLLDDALAEHRRENQRHLKRLIEDTRHLRKAERGWHLLLTVSEIEWLLQVLNDIRVGSWIVLGSPEKNLRDFELNENTAPHAWTMETAGWFEAALLEALHDEGGN